jgi:putative lipase involved disintegration of autophagic bodies
MRGYAYGPLHCTYKHRSTMSRLTCQYCICTPNLYDNNQCYALLSASSTCLVQIVFDCSICHRRSFDKQHSNNVGLVWQGDGFRFWIWSKMQHLDMHWSLKHRSRAGWQTGPWTKLENEDFWQWHHRFGEHLLFDHKINWLEQIRS